MPVSTRRRSFHLVSTSSGYQTGYQLEATAALSIAIFADIAGQEFLPGLPTEALCWIQPSDQAGFGYPPANLGLLGSVWFLVTFVAEIIVAVDAINYCWSDCSELAALPPEGLTAPLSLRCR